MTAEQALDVVERVVFVAGAMPDEIRAMKRLRTVVAQARTTVRVLKPANAGLAGNLSDALDGARSAAVR